MNALFCAVVISMTQEFEDEVSEKPLRPTEQHDCLKSDTFATAIDHAGSGDEQLLIYCGERSAPGLVSTGNTAMP